MENVISFHRSEHNTSGSQPGSDTTGGDQSELYHLLNSNSQHSIDRNLDESVEESANQAAEEVDTSQEQPLNATALCCSLGTLAGEKGFHCNVQYYLGRFMIDRNKNRVHNRALPFHGRDRAEGFGEASMNRFGTCLLGMGPARGARVFHSCCSAAARQRVNQDLVARQQASGTWHSTARLISILGDDQQNEEKEE